jgi:hypothetical protein
MRLLFFISWSYFLSRIILSLFIDLFFLWLWIWILFVELRFWFTFKIFLRMLICENLCLYRFSHKIIIWTLLLITIFMLLWFDVMWFCGFMFVLSMFWLSLRWVLASLMLLILPWNTFFWWCYYILEIFAGVFNLWEFFLMLILIRGRWLYLGIIWLYCVSL